MDNEDFNKLLLAVRYKDLDDAWGADVKHVLEELLRGEFSDRIEETKFKISIKRLKSGARASVNSINGKVYLFINPKNWESNPDFSNKLLKMVLRHELLHVELDMADDKDPRFIQEGLKRGIEFWG